ncbi:MAG: adenosylcobinamide-GDP ribazoletransferase [Pseudonocardiaceae bacterium]
MSRAGGLRLAVSWLTVLPITVGGTVDVDAGRRALLWAPAVGLALGGLAAGALALLGLAGAHPVLAGVLVVALLAAVTRGMHLDGLADTADGLGCYGGPQRALEVMRDGSAGPFAVVVLVLTLGAQAGALAGLVIAERWWAVVIAVTAGRVALGWCARRGVPPARPDGLGALVAGTQPLAAPVTGASALAAAGLVAVAGRPWQGVLAVLLAAGAVGWLSGHTARRFGGVTGDVCGAASEVAVTVVLVVCALG